MSKKIIAMIGLMGVGKTTLGSKLAQKLNIYFLDSDQEIEDSKKMSIADIFKLHGEKYFREVEKKTIFDIVNRDENMVLSLGGGAFVNNEIRNLLKEKAITVWLDADINNIILRIGKKNNRPLLNKKDKRKTLKDLYNKRAPIYREADIHIFSDQGSENETLEELVRKIKALNG